MIITILEILEVPLDCVTTFYLVILEVPLDFVKTFYQIISAICTESREQDSFGVY